MEGEKKYLSKEEIDRIVKDVDQKFVESEKERELKRMAKKESKQENLIPTWGEIVPPAEMGISVPDKIDALLNTSFVITGFEIFDIKNKPPKADGTKPKWARVDIKDVGIFDGNKKFISKRDKFPDGPRRTASAVLIKNMLKVKEQIDKTGIRVTLIQSEGKNYPTFV
jgi:hypothetical protein